MMMKASLGKGKIAGWKSPQKPKMKTTIRDPGKNTALRTVADREGPVVYRIDRDDRLVFVNERWSEFARDNNGTTLHAADVLGHSLWDFIPDAAVREIYRQIIAEVRSGRKLVFHYRCDSADHRRQLEMTVKRNEADEIEFSSRVGIIAPRSARPRPLASVPPGERIFLRMCSWCHSITAPDGTWLPLETAINKLRLLQGKAPWRVTHGVCPSCAEKMFADFQRYRSAPSKTGTVPARAESQNR